MLPITDENIRLAKDFCLKKWKERFHERFPSLAKDRPDLEPNDLTDSCKFTSLFALKVFGGVLRGNYHHFYVINNGKIIDLNIDAGDVKRLGNKAHRNDSKFLNRKSVQDSLDSCQPRVNQWVSEFYKSISLTESLNSPIKVDWVNRSYDEEDWLYHAEFQIEDGKFIVEFKQIDRYVWHIQFVRNDELKMTNTGNSFKVMSTVISAIKEFIKSVNPRSITFSASAQEESRIKVYDRLLSELVKEFSYELSPPRIRKYRNGETYKTYSLRRTS